MKRKMVILSLACLMALSGATGVHAEENLPVDESGAVSPLGKYEDPVTVEIVQSINPTLTIPEGDSATDNYYTRYIKDNMNIDISVKWSASSSDYNEKMNLAIAANDIPDILVVNEQQFRKLAQSDMLEDLTDYYDTYACDIIKQNIDSTEGKALENATYERKTSRSTRMLRMRGRRLCAHVDSSGLARSAGTRRHRQISKSWRRWRRAFVDNKTGGENTIGIVGPKTINGAVYDAFLSTNNLNNLDGIFPAGAELVGSPFR